MTIKEQIYSIIDKWTTENSGVYHYDDETDAEYCIEDVIIEFLMKHFDKSQYTCSMDEMFDNPGLTVYSLSIAWIEDGKIQTILNEVIENC